MTDQQSEVAGSRAAVRAASTVEGIREPVRGRIIRGSWGWLVTAGGVALALGVALLAFVWFLQRPLAIFFIGLTLAAAMAPVVEWISTWLPRTMAVVLAFLLLLLVAFLLGAIVIPPVVDQADAMADRLPELAESAQRWIERRSPFRDIQIVDRIADQLAGLSSMLVSLPLTISSALFDVFLVLFIAIYALVGAPASHKTILSLVPAEQEDRVNHILDSLVYTMGGYIRGVGITGVVIGSVSYVGLLLIGVNFPLALAIVAGLSEFLPFIGPFIAGALMVIVAFLQSPTKALIAVIFAVALQQLEGNLVAPNVMHPATCISPLTAIVALFAGASVGGILGALIAVPLVAAARVLVVELVLPAIRRQTGADPNEKGSTC